MGLLLLSTILAFGGTVSGEGVYVEEFDSPGKPQAPVGMEWSRVTELYFPVSWDEMVPGDGYAYLKAERAIFDNGVSRGKGPFQTLSIGPVEAGSRLSIRAKNTAVPGLVGLFFTYNEQGTFDEIDIEIVASDRTVRPAGQGGNWTDARFNTWAEADLNTLRPGNIKKSPLRNAAGIKVSHRDGKFHVYTLEWKPDSVRFLVDGVEQSSTRQFVPKRPATLIFGFRHMPWAGEPDWDGYQTMQVDWVKIEALSP
jgi:hypothetical protein